MKSNLNNFGVRKYESFSGRFTSVDLLWEKYYSWSPYIYSGHSPVIAKDGSGKWAKEISKKWHKYNGYISRNKNGYLAKKINFDFYDLYTQIAPNVAKYIRNNSFFVNQENLPDRIYGKAEIGGNYAEFDLTKKEALNDLSGSVLHEIIHLMGYGDFSAWSAMLAAGFDEERRIRSYIMSGDPADWSIIFDNIEEISQKTWNKYLDNEIDVDGIIKIMKNYGKTIINAKEK